jgi:flagellar biosynthesis component FlhA
MERELSQNIRMEKRLDIFGNGDGPTEIDTHSKQFQLEIQKLIKEAFYTTYLKSLEQQGLLSESISAKNLNDILPVIRASKSYLFLDRYIPKTKSRRS